MLGYSGSSPCRSGNDNYNVCIVRDASGGIIRSEEGDEVGGASHSIACICSVNTRASQEFFQGGQNILEGKI